MPAFTLFNQAVEAHTQAVMERAEAHGLPTTKFFWEQAREMQSKACADFLDNELAKMPESWSTGDLVRVLERMILSAGAKPKADRTLHEPPQEM